MGNKYSFKTSWNYDEEEFVMKLLCNGEVIEEKNFAGLLDMFYYIEETMCGLQIADEHWTFSY